MHIYAGPGVVRFMQGASLYHPDTVSRSIVHNGSGSVPGVKDENGNWDLRPHADRVILVAEQQLAAWAALIDDSDTPSDEARMLYPVNRASADVLGKIAAAPRLGDIDFEWTSGWNETTDRKLGYFRSASAVPDDWTKVILQGPHLTVATPLYQVPDTQPGRERLYAELNIESIEEDFIPRTNYQVAKPYNEYVAAYPKWRDKPSSAFFRLAWREMCDSATVRTLHSGLLPPGPAHVGGLLSLTVDDLKDIAVMAAFTSTLVADFLIKVMGVGHVKTSALGKVPHIRHHALEPHLILRILRLNCLVQPYAALWEELYTSVWQEDSWVSHIGVDYDDRVALGDVTPDWQRSTPLRRAADRRQALVEIDAIVAVMLGMTSEELLNTYRTQFPVLQKYERDALYDSNGRRLPGKLASESRRGKLAPADFEVGGVTYAEPFVGVDRERDMELAHKHFSDIAQS